MAGAELSAAAQTIAVDWSGLATGEREAIWLACVRDGRLVELENGWSRDELIGQVVERVRDEARTIVGLDFAFSFPRWYCEREGWQSGREVWRAMRDTGEELLRAGAPPFWGRRGTTAQTEGEALRTTDVGGAKSVFQIGGAGAVGTGSIRGMPYLLRLAEEGGMAVWPFNEPRWPVAIEIYPRALTGPVIKSRHRSRRNHLGQCFPEQPTDLRERAAGSEDAFDAAVSALVMARSLTGLDQLERFAPGRPERLEGAIWRPTQRPRSDEDA